MRTENLTGYAYNALAKIVTFCLTTVTNIVLARTLLTSDYGVVGFALIFMNLLAQFSDMGINSAIIQRREVDERTLATGFAIKVALGTVFYFLLFFLAPLLVHVFDNGEVVNVVRLLSLNVIISSFSFIPSSLLTRELSYGKLVLPQIGSSLAGASVSILLALRGHGYWSVIIGNICAVSVSTVLLNYLRPVRVKLGFDRTVFRELLRFGGSLFLFGVITLALFNADNLIVGTVAGSAVLGNYAVAFNWGTLICGLLTATVLVVLFPTLSKYQEDRTRIKESILHVLRTTALLSILANLGLFIVSKEFLVLVLGHGTDKWMPALAALRIFCIYGISRALLEPMGIVLAAIGRTGPLVKAATFAVFIEFALLYPVLTRFGIEGAAVLVTASYVTQYLIYVPVLRSELGLRRGDVIGAIYPAVLSGVLTAICVELLVGGGGLPVSAGIGAMKLAAGLAGFVALYGILSKWLLFKEARAVLRSWNAGTAI